VLGCAHLIAGRPGATVVTVFAGPPTAYPETMTWWDRLAGFGSGDDPLAARRDEDRAALAELGADPVWLDFVEHQYLDPPDRVQPVAVVDVLEAALRAAEPTTVVVPFGLANPDHECTHDACMLVRDRYIEPAWLCYEDTGYKHVPGLLAWRVTRLFRAGVWPTPVAPPAAPDPERKRNALARYRSQMRALEADWALSGKLHAPEQYWRLSPPPPGWQGLRER
jgi:LmbE family N-acetylglucosaminyl deacetylase